MFGAPEIFGVEETEIARVLFAREALFMLGVTSLTALPPPDLPEVAFAGRSNVGKSSLLNALVGRHRLARTSADPGRTRELNFFLLDERLRLVDLPGYGFAKVSRGQARQFQNLGRAYLQGRANLKRVYLLIDARHGLKATDAEALDALDQAAVSYQIVLTKADKLKAVETQARVAETLAKIAKRPAAFPRVAATSAEKGQGLPELRAEIAAAAFT
ncbi:MAG TPA: ribosome biogenesis GTP-binding protein YihA/YsxC [Caulobacteraceae bacterium]|nr:ribosome biogenesis GTP-binding protein YihA/YsxC [Caulobacteraceae bacterium]